jgi:hypothetical protein
MNTAAKASGAILTGDEGFVKYPLHKVVGVLETVEALERCIEELREHRFKNEDIETFYGDEGVEKIDLEGTRHGTMGKLLRIMQHLGPDRTYVERYEKYLRDGDAIIMVHVTNSGRKGMAAEVIHKYTHHRVTYFGLLMMEET